jgi:phosphoribosylformylglycinamidine synthase
MHYAVRKLRHASRITHHVLRKEIALRKHRFGVLIFPGSNGDHDALYMLNQVMGHEAAPVWHGARQVRGFDALVLPGGFSYGDYLRCGAIARFAPVMDAVRDFAAAGGPVLGICNGFQILTEAHLLPGGFSYGDYLRCGAIARFAPVMDAVCDFAAAGGPVLGICNGFQILTEAHLLPGALLRNAELSFACRWVHIRTEAGARATPFLAGVAPGTVWRLPIAHGEGCYYADQATVRDLEANGQVILRYCAPDGAITPDANPNGSTAAIAGVCNAAGNVLGLMPHPERAGEALIGGDDGRHLFAALLRALARGARQPAGAAVGS